MTRSSRLADLAQYAGVSEATVSRVLNDRPGVATHTRQAVLTALDVLGYERPSKLRRTSAGLVGLIVPELTNPIFPVFAQQIEGQLAGAGYTPVLCTQVAGGVSEQEYVQMLLDRGVAAIIFVNGRHADSTARLDTYHDLARQGLPVVAVNGPRAEIEAPQVALDDAEASRVAVRHLLDLGHTRIGLVTGPLRYVNVQQRVAGYRDAMAGVLPARELETLVQSTLFTVEGGASAGATLLRHGASAAVCGSDMLALGVVRAARAQGRRVPEDLSVIGSDDSPLLAFTDPPLTTVRQDIDAMSEAIVTAVLEQVGAAAASRAHRRLVFTPELVLRGSTAPAAPAEVTLHPAGASASRSSAPVR